MLIRAQTSPRSVKSKSISSELCEAALSSAAVRDFLFIFARISRVEESFLLPRAPPKGLSSTDYGALCGCCVHNAFIRNRLLLFHFRLRAKRISLRLYIIIIILRPAEKSDSADKLHRLNSHRFNMYWGIPLSVHEPSPQLRRHKFRPSPDKWFYFFLRGHQRQLALVFPRIFLRAVERSLFCFSGKCWGQFPAHPSPSHHRTLLILFPDNL